MDQAHFIFSSDKLELKSENGDFFVEGYISTSDIDLVNDIVTKACLFDMAEQMKQRTIKFDVEHESFRGKSNLEKEINKTTIPVAKVEDFLMDKKGLKVRAKLNKHSKRFNEVKGSIEEGFLDAFSIAYIPVKALIKNREGMEIRLLDKINLLNVAFTGNPVNTEARMTNVFAKSLEFLKDQEKAKAPKRSKPKVPESEYEDEEDEEEKRCKKKKEKKDHAHESEPIKLQEAKMSEDSEKQEAKPNEGTEAEAKPESQEKPTEEKPSEPEAKPAESSGENTEVKDLKAEVKSLREMTEAQAKELAELKAKVKEPIRKSPVEQQDKSKQFEESKSLNPLDVIQ
jgi:HK97 family phage prohead protease